MQLMNVAQAGASFACKSGNQYNVATTGIVTVNNGSDIADLLSQGFEIVLIDTREHSIFKAAAAANADLFFSSAALSSGTLTIAAQADTLRQIQAVALPGTTAISAGNLVLTYTANDGSTVVDTLSLATAASTNVTVTSSKGVSKLTSQVVVGLAGGATPTIRVGTNATLAVPTPQLLQAPTILKEMLDGADVATLGTTVGNYGLWTPNTAPNGTHLYQVVYSMVTPG